MLSFMHFFDTIFSYTHRPKYRKKYIRLAIIAILLHFVSASAFAQNQSVTEAFSSESFINWEDGVFFSKISLDTQQANISLASGRNAATSRILQQIPFLVKSPLLTVTIDSSTQVGDAILWNLLSMAKINDIINEGYNTPSVYSRVNYNMNMNHSIALSELAEPLIRHNNPYTPTIPIEQVSSRPYSGIIIDARGAFPVRGEFTQSRVEPAIFPKIWDDSMSLLYELNMVEPETVRMSGLITYSSSTDESKYAERIGTDPLRIRAREVFGIHRTDPVISKDDALKILSIPENVELLRQGKVVILLDADALAYQIQSPLKDEAYFFMVEEVSDFVYENRVEDLEVIDTERGMLIPLRDLQFLPNSAQLLEEENERLDIIAEALIMATQDNEHTILVEGHTADINYPAGEQELSVLRAQTIVDQLVARGVNAELFTYRGYGSTIPIGDNATEEGKQMNRRVEITVVPNVTYIQRIY